MATDAATQAKNKEVNTLKNKLRRQAEAEVLANHVDELNDAIGALFEANDLDFRPRQTKAQRAAEKVRKLIEENPELADQFASTGAVSGDEDDEDGTEG